MSDNNVGLVRDLYAAFGRGDIDTILAALAPDVSWESVGRPEDYPVFGPRRGVEAVRDFFRLVAENEDFSDFSPREFLAADDRVFVLGHYEATLRKTGRKIASDWVHVFTLRDGKVSRWREHTDTAQFAEAWRG